MNKRVTTTTKVSMDPKLKGMSKKGLPAGAVKPTYKIYKTTEEDKTILNVDSTIFFEELVKLIKGLEGQFYKSKLQQMTTINKTEKQEEKVAEKPVTNERPVLINEHPTEPAKMSDSFYLACVYETPPSADSKNAKSTPLYFKIMLQLSTETVKPPKTTNETVESLPTNNLNSQTIRTQAHLNNYANNSNKQITEKETVINELKIKTYYSFSHSTVQAREDLVENLIGAFNQQLNKLIKSVYLTMTLREIHDSRKWNTMLYLREVAPCSNNNENSNSSINQNSNNELTDESVSTENM